MNMSLTNKLFNRILKIIMTRFLSQKLGPDANIELDDFNIREDNGHVYLRTTVNIDLSNEALLDLIDI